jgi:hypothetical protein
MGLGYVEGVTHDYYRHGTTTLFAALNVLAGHALRNANHATGTRSSWPFSITSTAISQPDWKCT